MYKIIIFLITLLPFASFSQSKDLVSDSSWITNRAGIFYQVKIQIFSNGEETTTAIPIGDTATTTQKFRENIKSSAATFASDAQIVSAYRAQITELIRFGRTLPSILGKSPLDSIRAEQTDLLAVTGWNVRSINSVTGLRFRIAGTGVFQWKTDTTTIWRGAAFLGNVIRLTSFNGYTTDFFKNSKGYWTTINQQYTIRSPFSTLEKTTLQPEIEQLQSDLPFTELLTGGRVRIGKVVYKYNTKAKKWDQL